MFCVLVADENEGLLEGPLPWLCAAVPDVS